jgi:hypothetical protein
MIANLALGSLLIAATVLIQTAGLIILSRNVAMLARSFHLHRHTAGKLLAMISIVLGIFVIHTVEIWLWAIVFDAVGAVSGFENALYFSIVTFSTVGYGDITINPAWRMFAALEAMDGFILIGWSIAYLIAASTRHGPFRIGEHF